MSLIETNARIIADLEKEWSELGPLRQINFAVRFNDDSEIDEQAEPLEKQVARFIAYAEGEGCECSVVTDQYGDSTICVSKMMMPTAEGITALQEKLTEYTANHFRAYVDGWHYPPKKSVVFWPRASASDEQAALARAKVLFGGELVSDPLKSKNPFPESEYGRVARDPANACNFGFFGKAANNSVKEDHSNFRLIPSEFLRRAASKPPHEAESTVSAFSQWVYSLYSNNFGNDEDRNGGKEAEQDIWERRGEAFNCNSEDFLRKHTLPWVLVHNGLHLNQRDNPRYFELPDLRVRGKPLRASPDLIYRNKDASEIVIVEVKYTRLAIPKNLWPNVWAQLWCYAQIETVTRAKKLTVVGEVWGEMFSRGYGRGRNRVDGQRLVCLRASVRRDPRAHAYDRFFRNLFEIYSGK